jgi:hypothetical protein
MAMLFLPERFPQILQKYEAKIKFFLAHAHAREHVSKETIVEGKERHSMRRAQCYITRASCTKLLIQKIFVETNEENIEKIIFILKIVHEMTRDAARIIDCIQAFCQFLNFTSEIQLLERIDINVAREANTARDGERNPSLIQKRKAWLIGILRDSLAVLTEEIVKMPQYASTFLTLQYGLRFLSPIRIILGKRGKKISAEEDLQREEAHQKGVRRRQNISLTVEHTMLHLHDTSLSVPIIPPPVAPTILQPVAPTILQPIAAIILDPFKTVPTILQPVAPTILQPVAPTILQPIAAIILDPFKTVPTILVPISLHSATTILQPDATTILPIASAEVEFIPIMPSTAVNIVRDFVTLKKIFKATA